MCNGGDIKGPGNVQGPAYVYIATYATLSRHPAFAVVQRLPCKDYRNHNLTRQDLI